MKVGILHVSQYLEDNPFYNWWMEKLKRSGLSCKVASYVFYGNNVVFKTAHFVNTFQIFK